jgi:ParB family chromosome partitioning protein
LAARIKAAERADAAALEVSASPPRRSAELADLEAQFRNALMVKVELKSNTKGKGTLVLHFNTQDELERLYTRLVKHED